MITKLDIQEKDGFLIMEDFPANCIFNKVKTGCGATTIALTNCENYIIAVPTTELIENKCYPTKDVDGNVKFWKKHERKAGLSPVVTNLFGLYGNFTLELKKKLKDYLSSAGIKKIICTYDKIDKLMADGEIPTVKYTCLLREGIPEEEILAFAREESPLMIVMGTRGENMPEYGLMGSVTAEVIERSPVFVYSIPEEAGLTNFKEIHKVAFITNFDQRDLIAFDSLITTFKDYNFEIYFIHLNSNEERRTWNEIKLSGIKEYFHKQYPDLAINYSLVTEDSFFNNLDDYVKKECIDVLCVSNYKRNVFARLFNPSIAKKMIFHSRTPILVIK